MKTNLLGKFWLYLAVFACFGCFDPADPEEDTAPDAAEDNTADALPDELEEDAAETPDESAEEDGEPEAEAEDSPPDEASEDAEPEAEAEDDALEDGGGDAEDGETVDPCVPPDIPPTGLYFFFCLRDSILEGLTITLWRHIRLEWSDPIPWGEEDGCSVNNKAVLFCEVAYHRGATYYTDIKIVWWDTAWACGPGTETPYGRPRVWLEGVEQPLILSSDGTGGCYFEFSTPL